MTSKWMQGIMPKLKNRKGRKGHVHSKRSIKNKEHFLLHPKYLSGEREVMERYVHE